MTLEQLITVIGFALTVAAILWNGGRQAQRVDSRISELQLAVNGRIDLVANTVASASNVTTLQYQQLTEKVGALNVEVVRVRDDRHDLTGRVMQHAGQLGEHARQIASLDTRVSRVEHDTARTS